MKNEQLEVLIEEVLSEMDVDMDQEDTDDEVDIVIDDETPEEGDDDSDHVTDLMSIIRGDSEATGHISQIKSLEDKIRVAARFTKEFFDLDFSLLSEAFSHLAQAESGKTEDDVDVDLEIED